MRTEFPAMHTSLERPPRSPDREKRSRNRRAAFATRGVFFVRPKSERTSSLQFVATYFGRYSSNADDPGFTHCPEGCWPRRICAAHPFLPISRWARCPLPSSGPRFKSGRRDFPSPMRGESDAWSRDGAHLRARSRLVFSGLVGACRHRKGLLLRGGGGPPLGQPEIQEHRLAEPGDDGPLVGQAVPGRVRVIEGMPSLNQSPHFEHPELPDHFSLREVPQDRGELGGANGLLEIDRRQDLEEAIPEHAARDRDVPSDRLFDLHLGHRPGPEVYVLGEPEAHFREDGEPLHEVPEDVFVLWGETNGGGRSRTGGCLTASHARLHAWAYDPRVCGRHLHTR